jgi:putative oxidoreductase
MKIAVIIVRILMGLLFLVPAIDFFFHLFPHPEPEGEVKLFMTGMMASKYLLPVVKVIELLAALAFISGRFVPLAAVVIFPIIVNIILFHAFLDPANILIPIFLLAGDLFLAYVYRDRYKPLFLAK